MEFTDYMIWKAVAICVVVGLVSFFYAAITGKTIEQARSEKEKARLDQTEN